ncbi:MAG: dienelactone hydrolase family protein [Ahrensia sp.]
MNARFGWLVGFAALVAPSLVHAQALDAHKDSLFTYPAILEIRDGGAYRIVDYNEARDINARDQVPERRVNARYVARNRATKEKQLTLDTDAGPAKFAMVGNLDGARLITIFVHGRGGDRRLGQNDFSFGGNFNRIKNLMVRNRGVYITVDAGDFRRSDVARVAAVARLHLEAAPGAELILACGSAGGAVCHSLADAPDIGVRTAGIAFLGSYADPGFIQSDAVQAKVPVFIGHGSNDSVFAMDGMDAFYAQLRRAGVPVQLVRFETGGHGTPIRMTDWRAMINWMLSQ